MLATGILGTLILARPIASIAALEVLFVTVTVGGAFGVGALVPGLPGYSTTGVSRALVVAAINAALVVAIIAAFRWWRAAGFTRLSEWRELRFYWSPAVLVFVPFAAGVRMPAASPRLTEPSERLPRR